MISLIRKLVLIVLVFCLSACAIIVDRPYDKNKVILPPSSTTVSSLLAKSDQYQIDGRLQQSLITLERAIQIEPVDPVPWYRAAKTYFAMVQYDQAIDFAQRVRRHYQAHIHRSGADAGA